MSLLDDFYELKKQEQTEKEEKSVSKAVTESVVEAAALATPGLGILLGSILSGRSILEGKPKEAIFRLAAGISGTFPGLGTVASLYLSGIGRFDNVKKVMETQNITTKKIQKIERYIKKMISSASTYEDEKIKNLFASGDDDNDFRTCLEMLALLEEKRLKPPANPTDIFETMFFKDNGSVTITYFTDDKGVNYWAANREERIALRERTKNYMHNQRALYDITDTSPSKNSGDSNLDKLLKAKK